MSFWSGHLDRLVSGTAKLPPSAVNLELGAICEWRPGYARKEWPINPKFFSATELFGGYLSAMADQLLVLAALSLLEDGQTPRTTSLQIDFFKPVSQGVLIVEGNVVSRSRRLLFVEVTFTNAGELVAKARGSIYVVNPSSNGIPPNLPTQENDSST